MNKRLYRKDRTKYEKSAVRGYTRMSSIRGVLEKHDLLYRVYTIVKQSMQHNDDG